MSGYLQKQINDRMMSKNLSIYALEKKAGLNRSAVRNILQGFSKNPGIQILDAVAKVLECTVEDLVGTETAQSMPAATRNVVKAKEIYMWKKELYLEAVEVISKIAQDKNLNLNLEQITSMVNEAYKYTVSNEMNHVDQNFCKWLFTKSF